jgi:opacity protein-like surface antigen
MGRFWGRSSACILAALVAASVISRASAADLLPEPMEPAPPPPPVEFSGWYLRGDIGYGATQISDWRSTLAPVNAFGNPPPAVLPVFASLGDSGFFDAGFGYQFNNWLRVDLTGEYRTQANYRAAVTWFDPGTGNAGADVYSAGHNAALFLANGYIDLGTWFGITPFVGGGVGLVARGLDGLIDNTFGYARDTSKTSFAWHVGAGLAFNVTPNFKMELGYRYLDMGSIKSNPIVCLQVAACWYEQQSFSVASHDVRLGFRYHFAQAAPVVFAPPPLVSKY